MQDANGSSEGSQIHLTTEARSTRSHPPISNSPGTVAHASCLSVCSVFPW